MKERQQTRPYFVVVRITDLRAEHIVMDHTSILIGEEATLISNISLFRDGLYHSRKFDWPNWEMASFEGTVPNPSIHI